RRVTIIGTVDPDVFSKKIVIPNVVSDYSSAPKGGGALTIIGGRKPKVSVGLVGNPFTVAKAIKSVTRKK
ncbi:MAG TPA: hypothetical protein VMX56_04410, partial [Anaerolineales bacterium]|nr:hypothetical protein [Anaerolineales bacterium]